VRRRFIRVWRFAQFLSLSVLFSLALPIALFHLLLPMFGHFPAAAVSMLITHSLRYMSAADGKSDEDVRSQSNMSEQLDDARSESRFLACLALVSTHRAYEIYQQQTFVSRSYLLSSI